MPSRIPGFISRLRKNVQTDEIEDLAVTEAKLATAAAAKLNTKVGNFLDNGDFQIWQRGSTIHAGSTFPNNDAGVCADRWIMLTQANDRVDFNRTDIAAGTQPIETRYHMKMLTVAANEKSGIFQIIEGAQSKVLMQGAADGLFTLSFWAKVNNTRIELIRYGVMAWDGTEDTFSTSLDPINTWESAGTQQGLKTDWTWRYTATSAPTTGWVKYTLVGDLQSNEKNLGVFIGIDSSTFNAGDSLDIAQVQLEAGGSAGDYRHRSFQEELLACKRHFSKTFDYDVAPAQNAGTGTGELLAVANGADLVFQFDHGPMAKVQLGSSVVTYCPNAATANAERLDGGVDEPIASIHDGTNQACLYATSAPADAYSIHVTVQTFW